MTTQSITNSINRSPLRRIFLLIPLAFVCFALSPTVQATDLGSVLPNGNTADGSGVLTSLSTTANNNTAIGYQALHFNVSGIDNTAEGYSALFDNAFGNLNTAIGFQALKNNTSSINTAVGANALLNNTTGNFNTAIGYSALDSNQNGTHNTAVGSSSLLDNIGGNYNTANGVNALRSNMSGHYNTAEGLNALYYNTAGIQNTANGVAALQNNNGNYNTANGVNALFSNTTGTQNTANGAQALYYNTTGGNYNTAEGFSALLRNTSGSSNTAVGKNALFSNTSGSNNIAVGNFAGSNLTTGSNNIDIGHHGFPGEDNTIRIGNLQKLYMDPIVNFDASAGLPVYILDGRLGMGPVCPPPTCGTSSERFKDGIKPMDKASEAILALKPVTFRYKKQFEPKGIPQFGLVAEDVQKVNPDLVVRDPQGKPYGVRYDAVNAMLLNEFLKEHRTVQEQKMTISELKSAVAKQEAIAAHQQKQIETLTAGLRKVSAQVEMSRPAPQTVGNNQ